MNTLIASNRLSWAKVSAAVLAIAGCALLAGAADPPAPPTEYPGYTAPSEKRVQNFDVPGVVQKVLVKEGDTVKAGDVIAEQTLDAEKAHLKSLELTTQSTLLEAKAEQAQLDKDKVQLARDEQQFEKHVINTSQIEEIRLTVKIDSYKLEHAQMDHEKGGADIEEQKARIELRRLHAKINGVISEINVHEGELATTNNDPQRPGALTIVKNDPLYIEVDLPSDQVTRLKANPARKTLQVQYVDDKTTWHDAKIHFIKPEADPRSNTEHVQLEMPNPEGRSSGLQVVVRMPANGAAPVGAVGAANVGH